MSSSRARKVKIVTLSLLVSAAAVLTACQTGAPSNDPTNIDSLEARAVERWNYLIEKHPEKAYEFLTPGFRKTMTAQEYAASKAAVALKWKQVKATKKECEEDVCTVYLSLDYEVLLPNTGGKPISTFAPLREKWVKIDNKWYFLPDK